MMTEPETEIHPLLVPLINPDHVFEKDTYSAFKAPGLIEFLKTYDITDITVCGIDTDACILATLFDGFDKGYNIRALTELCGSNSGKSLHDAALAVINRNLQ
jgi:nicotinamidase-related amidase